MVKTMEKETTAQAPASDGYKSAPTPGGNFVKLPMGGTVEGKMVQAEFEIETVKGKKGKESTKEKYKFGIELAGDTTLVVGKKKNPKDRLFQAGDVVILPDHGYLTSVMRRTACAIKGVPFVDKEDTDLKPLLGCFFIITRLEDGEIAAGPYAGTVSALYDVKYKVPSLA